EGAGLEHGFGAPAMAVDLGLQVNASKLPQPMLDIFMGDDFAAKQAALNDPMAARMLMQADAVVGVKARFEDPNDPMRVTELGLTCAVCHVTVSKTPVQLAEGEAPVDLPIGMPVFGPPNTRLNASGLLSASPALPVERNGRDATLAELDWPRGSADPRFFPNNPFDDDAINPTSIPPHWNFLDLAEQSYAVTWNGVIQSRPGNDAIAAAAECGIDLVMGANGAFGTSLPQVLQAGSSNSAAITNFEIGNDLPQEFWDRLAVAEIEEPGNEVSEANLLDVQAFLQSIVSPPPGPFDEAKAEQGMELFFGKANCVACHNSAEGTGAEGQYFTNITEQAPTGLLALGIKTPGLRGLAFTAPYFHDGSAATLEEVVARYTSEDIPEVPSYLTAGEQAAIVEYLKSL
ncbi:MAG: c-type cytochrome, partial [Gammaproteobacteria bacterium]|nr:c-type cytochrome [Gammaproteobacteria bacterium]